MHIYFAQLSIVLTIFLGALSIFLIPAARFSPKRIVKVFELIIFVQFSMIAYSFIALSYSYLTSDFSIENVFKNSHQAIPILYKLTGLWSNHEGSMLLWVFLLSACNLVFIFHKIDVEDRFWIHFIQIILVSSISGYIIIKSNPFVLLSHTPQQGIGFNPLLQDVGLAIHPPILYLGYVSSSIAFAIACAALIRKKIPLKLLEIMQAWNLFSWSFLSLGISLGSWWAYRELGWGGYWFWDPVENASLMPWLSSIALLHSIYSTKKLNTNYSSTFALAICGFLLTMLTGFFVRSGIVTSVHSFAHDIGRGSFILKLLLLYSFFALSLFATRIHHFNSSKGYSWVSRLGGINLSNILWSICIIIILFSLVYPLIINNLYGHQISVESNFFKQSFIPLTGVILIILATTLPATWHNILNIHYRHLAYSTLISIAITLGYHLVSPHTPSLMNLFIFFSGCLVSIRMGFWIVTREKITFKFLVIWLVHIIAGLFAITTSYIECNSKEIIVTIKEDETINFINYTIKFVRKENLAQDNYIAGKVILNVFKNNHEICNLTPEIRYYPIEKTQTTESSIYHSFFYDLYAVISEINPNGKVSIKLYFKPLINWLWAISVLTFLSGIALLLNDYFKKKKNATN